MKQFILLSYGFVQPTPEIGAAWGKWFKSIGESMTDAGHLMHGWEYTKDATQDLPLGMDSVTGFVMINAESREEAERIARECPIISGIRVYEVMRQG